MIVALIPDSGAFCEKIYTVCTAAKGNLTQSSQIVYGKKMSICKSGLIFFVYAAVIQTFQQFRRFNINKLYLIGQVENRIRNTVLYWYAGDGRDSII